MSDRKWRATAFKHDSNEELVEYWLWLYRLEHDPENERPAFHRGLRMKAERYMRKRGVPIPPEEPAQRRAGSDA